MRRRVTNPVGDLVDVEFVLQVQLDEVDRTLNTLDMRSLAGHLNYPITSNGGESLDLLRYFGRAPQKYDSCFRLTRPKPVPPWSETFADWVVHHFETCAAHCPK